ncbi:MAG: hypothetical protein KC619_21755 [Myxococcales bacterium]|nr:hypothetical protein [Myxococcales bacterium]
MRRLVPAAHSMDTTWFAVDADGFVAAFESGEAGAVPMNAAAGPEAGDFDAWPLELALVARALGDGTFPEEEDLPLPSYRQEAVLVLRPDEDDSPTTYRDAAGRAYSVHERLGEGWLVLRDAEPRVVVSTQPVEPDRMASLAEDAGVARVIVADEIAYWREDGGGALYRYQNDDYGNPGAYARSEVPIEPLEAESLPEAVRERVVALRLDVRFADAPALHLADHLAETECHIWGETDLHGRSPEADAAPQTAPTAPRTARLILLAVAVLAALALLLWLLR